MENELIIGGNKIPKADWEVTPASVKAVVEVLSERSEHLAEQLKQNSKNSSVPPSKDIFGKSEKKEAKEKKGKKRRKVKKKKEKGFGFELYPEKDCVAVHQHIPENCRHCGEVLAGKDENPVRHQVIEIPKIAVRVEEHQRHQLICDCCGKGTRAELPEGVPSNGYGDRLVSLVGLLSSGEYRQSHSMVQSLMSVLFNLELSRTGINRMRTQVSKAVAGAVAEAKEYVQAQPSVHSDETGFRQRNRDGNNPKGSKGWLWVLCSPLVSVFQVTLSRAQQIAEELIGKDFKGIVHSDRYSAYGWLQESQRQLCWAHLKRDLTKIAERSGVSQEIGLALLARQRRLFRWWHRVRDGTLSRTQFIASVTPLRAGFKQELEEAAAQQIGSQEKTPLAKTVRTLRRILKVEQALWTFVDTPGIEPTNNNAERALRPAVIWRRTTQGSQSQKGSEFVARILSVTHSLKAQGRDPWDYLADACRAHRLGLDTPSLIPDDSPLPPWQAIGLQCPQLPMAT